MKKKEIIAIAAVVVLAVSFFAPMLRDIDTAVPGLDWYAVYAYNLYPRISIQDFRQFPLRSAHFGGGYPLVAHPYDISLSPFSWPVLLFGDIAGTKIAVLFLFLAGTLGVFLIVRRMLNFGIFASLFSALTFAFSSWGPCVYLDSNFEKLQIYLLPPLVFLFFRSWEDRRFIFFAALVLGLLVLSSGAMFLPAALFLLLFALLFNPRSLKKLFLVMCLAFLFSAVKILPMQGLIAHPGKGAVHFSGENDYSQVSRHILKEKRALDAAGLYRMLFVRDGYIVGTDWVTGDDHLQLNLGVIPVVLAFCWFLLCWRKSWRYLAIFSVFLLLSFGPNSRPDLFHWFWQSVPYAHAIWRPDEFFTFPLLLVLAIACGGALDIWKRGPKPALYAALIVAVIGLNNMFWPNRRFLYNETLAESPKKMVTLLTAEERKLGFSPDFFQVRIKDPQADPEHYQKDGYFYLRQNIGVANWLYTNLEIKSAVIPRYFIRPGDYLYARTRPERLEKNPAYQGEVFFPEADNKAVIERFSPGRIAVRADLKVPGMLVVNQNYHPSWRSSQGRICDYNGLLGVALQEAGVYELELSYVPRDFYLGLFISVCAVCAGIYFFLCRKKESHERKNA